MIRCIEHDKIMRRVAIQHPYNVIDNFAWECDDGCHVVESLLKQTKGRMWKGRVIEIKPVAVIVVGLVALALGMQFC